jgi:ketosteroid isomerase-like protein
MKNSTAKEVLANYYDDLAQKREGWQSLLSGEVVFTGPGKTHRGQDAFINTLNNFMRRVKTMNVKQVIGGDEHAAAIVNYDLISPQGTMFNIDVAEIWKVENGKLDSLAIFFDTAAFTRSMANE